MISKSDVTDWFKTLQSYKRIDTMCALLNICLPFELRFLGTCLEELGRRDSQELRGMELRVNNPQELAMDVSDCQKGEPTDIKIRRKLALHLALMRACNRNCVNEIFHTLEAWGELDFTTITDCDTLEELLLVYTMAANHPVFDFEQHMKCVQIFAKIKENKLVADPVPMTSAHNPLMVTTNWPACHKIKIQQKQLHTQPMEKIDLVQQTTLQTNALHTTAQHLQVLDSKPTQMLPQASFPLNFAQSHLVKFLSSSDDGNLPSHITGDSMSHMLTTNHTIPEINSMTTIGPNNVGTWTTRQYQSSATPAIPPLPKSSSPLTDVGISQMKDNLQAAQCTSPLISQQSSPCSSRTVSPQRDCTPHQQIPQHLPLPTMPLHPNSQVVTTENSDNQLQHLMRNGFNRSNNPSIMKSCNYPSTQHQQQHQHYQGVYNVATGLMYAMQNISLNELPVGGNYRHQQSQQQQQLQHQQQQHTQSTHQKHQQQQQIPQQQQHLQHTQQQQQQHTQSQQQPYPNQQASYTAIDCKIALNSNKSTCSDSGSSIGSTGDVSPPETPSLHSNNNYNPIALRISTNTTTGSVNGAIGDNRKNYHQHPPQLNYNNKHVSLTKLNGRLEKLTNNGTSSNSSNYSQQQHPPPLYADILFAPISNAVPSTLMSAPPLATNNSGGNGNSSSNGSPMVEGNNNNSNNNNIGGNTTVLITTPSAVTVSIGNVITSNSILLQTHQPQYRNSYPYHSAVAAATVQHLASNGSRPPAPSPAAPNVIMNHNVVPPSMVSQTHATFRLPGFQISPNSDVIFPTYHPAVGNMPFLSDVANTANITGPPSTVTAPNVSVVLRSNNSVAQQLPATATSVTPAAQLQHSPTVAILATPPFGNSSLNMNNKPLSCYNCGSQTHSGRECQEASMDDVTRSAIYKLDYSQVAFTAPGSGSGISIAVAAAAATGTTTGVSVGNCPIINNQLSLDSSSNAEAPNAEKKNQDGTNVVQGATALSPVNIGATAKPTTTVVPAAAAVSAAAK